jgi:transposase-like protein
VFLSLQLGNRESDEAWRDFLRDLAARGLAAPLTVTADGAPGLLRAVAECWPRSLRLRCWVHKARNVEAKVPAARWPEVKAHLYAVRDAATRATAEVAVQDFLARYGRELPSAGACLSEDLDALLGHLALPWRHRKTVRSTNLCERSFVEERRRSKTLPRFFTERSCLKLVYATLIRAATLWRKVPISAMEVEQLKLLYQERGLAPLHPLEVAA